MIMDGRYRLNAKERNLRDHFGLDEDPHWGAALEHRPIHHTYTQSTVKTQRRRLVIWPKAIILLLAKESITRACHG